MSFKTFVRISVLMTMLVSALAIPVNVLAGGVCGGAYIVDPGDTFSKIAAKCGTTVSAITSANPGVSEPLKTGQTLNVPGITYNSTPVSNTPAPVATATYIPLSNFTGKYTVQVGDTFSNIATRYGVSVNDLWAANPNIQDINYLYVGQVLNVPSASAVIVGNSTPAPADVPLSYGTVPYGSPKGQNCII
ncbi:MAG: LysM peptidoglycan-binding domain-containing protein [Anaerolineales bacterium]